MKYIIAILTLLLTVNLSAQSWFGKSIKGNGEKSNITRNIDNYDKITVAGPFEINLVKGIEGKLEITIEENLEEYLVTKVKDGKLLIRWKECCKINPRKKVSITIPFKNIEALTLAGSGEIKNKDKITSNDFTIKLAGSGNINLLLSSKQVKCTMAGSGTVSLEGDSVDFECSKAGSGDYFGYDFICRNIDIEGAGSGDAQVNATDVLEAKIAGSGNIYYKGNPTKNSIKNVGSGSAIMK